MEYLIILVGIAAVVAVAVAAKAFLGADASKGTKTAVATLFLCFAAAPIMPPPWMKRLIVALLPAASAFDG